MISNAAPYAILTKSSSVQMSSSPKDAALPTTSVSSVLRVTIQFGVCAPEAILEDRF